MLQIGYTIKRFSFKCAGSPPFRPSFPSSYQDIRFHHMNKSVWSSSSPPTGNAVIIQPLNLNLPSLKLTACSPPLEGEKGAPILFSMIWKLQKYTATAFFGLFVFLLCGSAGEPIKTAAVLCVSLDLCSFLHCATVNLNMLINMHIHTGYHTHSPLVLFPCNSAERICSRAERFDNFVCVCVCEQCVAPPVIEHVP